MKNLRMAKKNPSKILKIIEPLHSQRYGTSRDHHPNSQHIQDLAITSSREKKSGGHERGSQSPNCSQRIIEFTSLERTKKIRSKSLNRSEELIKT